MKAIQIIKMLLCVGMSVLGCVDRLSAQGSAVEPRSAADHILASVITDGVAAERYVWNWRDAVVLKALTEVYEVRSDLQGPIEEWVAVAMRTNADRKYGLHPNAVASGVGVAFMARVCPSDPFFQAKADEVYKAYKRIRRWERKASSHRPTRVELWDDTVYMLSIYLLEMYQTTGKSFYLEDCVREVLGHAEKLRNTKTNLWYHGWSATNYYYQDDCCEFLWNSNHLQRNTEYWGRGNGWIAMALVDLLEVLPTDHPNYKEVKDMYVGMMQTLHKLQDKATGHWYQLPARPSDTARGNYIESSATVMFGYAMAKGERLGLLKGGKWRKAAQRAWEGVQTHSLRGGNGKRITLGNVCAGTCIGERDYYYARPITEGESFADGALLLFAYEMER